MSCNSLYSITKLDIHYKMTSASLGGTFLLLNRHSDTFLQTKIAKLAHQCVYFNLLKYLQKALASERETQTATLDCSLGTQAELRVSGRVSSPARAPSVAIFAAAHICM